MSGGSYDYLYCKSTDQLLGSDLVQSTIQSMADRLAGLSYANDAAKETEELLLTIRQVTNRLDTIRERLSPVWHAIEWWDSCDSGEDSVKEALRKYRGE